MAVVIVLSMVPENNPFEEERGRGRSGRSRTSRKILEVSAFKEVSWGVVFLLGGGFALSLGIEKSGLMENIAAALNYLKVAAPSLPLFWGDFLFVFTLFSDFERVAFSTLLSLTRVT